MRAILCMFLCACAWKIDSNDDFLPLEGEFVDLTSLPQLKSYHFGPFDLDDDGRVWSVDNFYGPMHSLEIPSKDFFADGTVGVAPEGVLTIVPASPPPTTQFHIALSTPEESPSFERDVTVSEPTFQPSASRGSGYFVVLDPPPDDFASPSPSPSPSPWPLHTHLAFDDGHDETIPGETPWFPMFVSDHYGPVLSVTAGPRFLLLSSYYERQVVAVYDLQSHELRTLFDAPTFVTMDQGSIRVEASLFSFYDQPRERFWMAGDRTYLADLLGNTVTELPFATIDLRLDRATGEVLLQNVDGSVYAVTPDGATELLGQYDPNALRASVGRTFVHTKKGFDNLDRGAYRGWIGDREVIHAGVDATFSADGTRLYWLENAANDSRVGDLYSLDLATMTRHPLVRNVTGFSELPDGRLIAIANAALEGAWNRAVIVDEANHRQLRLAEGVQYLSVEGDRVVLGRHTDATLVIFLAL